VEIPKELKPKDGRFGSGPSKVRIEQLDALVASNPKFLGTSHRKKPVKDEVKKLRTNLRQLFSLPDAYEVILGNGGATAFWDAAIFGLIKDNAQFLSFGEFSGKFASGAKSAPHISIVDVRKSEPGTAPSFAPNPDFDTYATAHNETSTGVMPSFTKPTGAASDSLLLVDATSAAGGATVAAKDFDVYYFAPQKSFGSDGGLWLALMSPAALARVAEIKATDRYQPPFLDLSIAVENSLLDQTYNTPALATILMMSAQVDSMLENGGLKWCDARTKESSQIVYQWAESRDFASPFVSEVALRSQVVATIDFDESIDAVALADFLRANGIVDTDSYRKLGRNQLRIATFPAVEPDDVRALTACIDWSVENYPTKS
jgi:phosphoserine aminotransferase